MNSPETVEINSDDIESTSLYTQTTVDSLYERQKREVSQMRASLLACNESDIRSVRTVSSFSSASRARFSGMLKIIVTAIWVSFHSKFFHCTSCRTAYTAVLVHTVPLYRNLRSAARHTAFRLHTVVRYWKAVLSPR